MAPNRKSLTALAQCMSHAELEDLQSTLLLSPKTAAFLPLTHPNEEAVTKTLKPVISSDSNTDSASYWEWSDNIQTEPVCVLSTSNIVSNLIQSAKSPVVVEPSSSSSSSSAASQQQTLAENDDYWAEGEEEEQQQQHVASAPQHESVSYWEWDTEHSISKPSSKSYWTWESEPCSSFTTTTTTTASTQADEYWAWDTSCQQVAALVLATNAMLRIRKEQQQQQSQSEMYWTWPGYSSRDHYWDMPTTLAVATTTSTTSGNQGYWEW